MIKVCENCKREFKTYHTDRKFCSKICFRENQIKEHSGICPICKNTFHKKRKEQIFCSTKCRDEGHKNGEILTCEVCKKEFYRSYSAIRQNNSHCCSVECSAKRKSKYSSFLDESAKNLQIYNIWKGMISRCENPQISSFKNYGQRGITVCSEWHDFQLFYQWAIDNGYKEGLSIERIDVNKGYYKDNCTWIKPEEQAKNKRNNIRVFYNGKEMILKDVAIEADVDYKSLWQVYKRKQNIEEAVRICNLHKQGLTSANTSGVKGISFSHNAWMLKYKNKYIGRYKTIEEAVQAKLNIENEYKKRAE